MLVDRLPKKLFKEGFYAFQKIDILAVSDWLYVSVLTSLCRAVGGL
jgi:hypothetical protein